MNRFGFPLLVACLIGFCSCVSQSQSLFAPDRSPRFGIPGRAVDAAAAAAARRTALALRGLGFPVRGLVRPDVARARPRVAAGLFIVRFKQGVNARTRAALHAAARATVVGEIPQLQIQTIRASDRAVARYRNDPNVAWIEPDAMRYPLVIDPNDPAYNYIDYGMSFLGDWGTYRKWDAHNVQAVDAWSIWPGHYYTAAGGKGTDAVRIAVIDTGVDEGHEDFKNAGGTSTDASLGGQLLLSLNRTIFAGSSTPGAPDAFGHGTHTTGIAAAATNNGIGTTGNGINASVIDIRVTDSQGNGTASDLAAAIVYAADNGAVIANISLGDYTYSQAEQDAVTYAWGKGMLVVAAAGNDAQDTSVQPVYPGALPRVLGVSAVTWDDYLTTYSNFGDAIGIGAPGGDLDYANLAFVGVYSTTPQYTVTMNTDPNYMAQMNYDYFAGTSMASPEVVGAAALYAGMRGWRTATPGAPLQIWQALQRGADAISGDPVWTPYYGWGRLNMYNTMNLAADPNPRGDPPGGPIGGIVGQVRYLGTAVRNANVVATKSGGGSFSATSRDDGGYRLPNIPSGTYSVSATYFGATQTTSNLTVSTGCDLPGVDFNIGVSTVPISGLTLSPTTVAGTKASTGTVTLAAAAPSGGVVVTLSSSASSIAYPAVSSVTVGAGYKTAGFVVKTNTSASATTVTISGTTSDGTVKSADLTVRPPNLTSITVSPTSVAGSKNVTGRATLEAAAPAGGMVVALSSSDAATAYPAVSTVTIPAGSTYANFTIQTVTVTASKTVTISGTLTGITKSAILTVRPPNLLSVTVSPTSVAGSLNSTGRATLEAAAPAGGMTVAVSSSDPATANPTVSSVTIAAGSTYATFTITTAIVTTSKSVTISGTLNGITKSATLTVRPPNISSISASPNPVAGSLPATGRANLETYAPQGGILVTLSSGNTSLATVPASVTVPEGAKTITFPIATYPVTAKTGVILTGKTGTVSKSTTLSVRPIGPYSVSLTPNPVVGGNSVAGTVTLEAPAAPGPITVTLTSSNTAYATVPSSITIPAGLTTGAFTVATVHPAAQTTSVITSAAGGISKSRTLTIKP